jgi:Spy/CpxP family protein refolding chaperone
VSDLWKLLKIENLTDEQAQALAKIFEEKNNSNTESNHRPYHLTK